MSKQLDKLLTDLRRVKEMEASLKSDRLDIEDSILALLPKQHDLESTFHDPAERFSVAYKLTRTVNSKAVEAAWADMSRNAQRAFKVGFDLDLRGYRAILELDNEAAAEVGKFVTTKPAKSAITLKD